MSFSPSLVCPAFLFFLLLLASPLSAALTMPAPKRLAPALMPEEGRKPCDWPRARPPPL
jgi:hypothetical protein